MNDRPPRATVDFETRSACSIRNCGSWRYSLDPTTDVLCLAFRLPHWPEGKVGLWHPAFPHLDIEEGENFDDLAELFTWINDGELVEAHNCFFERGIWRNICVPRYGWPEVKHQQYRCSAAKAAALSLPRSLGDACVAVDVDVRKDEEGAALMKKLVKPRKALKAEWLAWGRRHAPCPVCEAKGKVKGINPDTGRAKMLPCGRCGGLGYNARVDLPEMPILWHESREQFERLWLYCQIDVLAEEALSNALPDLSPEEQEMYLLDQCINERGFELDPAAIDTALDLIDEEFATLNLELRELTGGRVERATQRARMLEWFADNGLELDDTQADTIDETLTRTDISPNVRRGLELMRTLGRSSTAKFEAMRNWVCPDSRVHGGLLYHGATTGRWTGAGVQPHNFPRGAFKEDQEVLWEVLKLRDREIIADEYGDVMTALSTGLRGVIVAGEGRTLYVADFNAIETRVLFWLANEQDGLDVFRRGEDIYMDFATTVMGYPVTDKKKQDKERQFGKVGILGLGFQCGVSKFVEVALDLGGITIEEDLFCQHPMGVQRDGPVQNICGLTAANHDQEKHPFTHPDPDEITSRKVVDAYRTKYWRVKQLWRDTEQAAIRAVQRQGKPQPCGKYSFIADDTFLYCVLPSGRKLAYPEPAIQQRKTPWGDLKPSLTYMGMDQFTRQWKRQHSYGGLLVENATQAVARDLLAAAMKRAEKGGVYAPVLSVHDEIIAEAAVGTGSVEEFEHLMASIPRWAQGLPVAAEGWSGKRYRK